MYEIVDGQATEIAYDSAMFDYGKSGVKAGSLPKDLGFAGFRLNYRDDFVRDVAAFQGASYFRAVGGDKQYGRSEEHTSELQSLMRISYAVFCLKKKNKETTT